MKKLATKLKKKSNKNIKTASQIAIVIIIAIIGVHFLIGSHAASPFVSVNADTGKLNGGASITNDATARDGHGVQFGAPLSISVNGNHLVNGNGQTIRLLGANVSGSEYCSTTHSINGGRPLNSTEAEAIASWKINAVRVPLNEDCWLGINGVSLSSTVNGKSVTLTGSAAAQAYQTAIESWVTDLNNAGIYTIIDLHWSAPGNILTVQQWGMADQDHSPTFWSSVATTFKSYPAVMYDLFNEPFIGNPNATTTTPPWTCWLNGCSLTFSGNTTSPVNPAVTYNTAGMQQLVNTIRATGASQPIILSGIRGSSDPCGVINKFGSSAACPELANMPTDPNHKLIVAYHNYSDGSIPASSYWIPHWDAEQNPITSAGIPVVTDEFGESDCSVNFMNMYMTWADQNNESYLAWTWNPTGTSATQCSVNISDGAKYWSNYGLLSNYDGTASTVSPQGSNYKTHLAQVSPY